MKKWSVGGLIECLTVGVFAYGVAADKMDGDEWLVLAIIFAGLSVSRAVRNCPAGTVGINGCVFEVATTGHDPLISIGTKKTGA